MRSLLGALAVIGAALLAVPSTACDWGNCDLETAAHCDSATSYVECSETEGGDTILTPNICDQGQVCRMLIPNEPTCVSPDAGAPRHEIAGCKTAPKAILLGNELIVDVPLYGTIGFVEVVPPLWSNGTLAVDVLEPSPSILALRMVDCENVTVDADAGADAGASTTATLGTLMVAAAPTSAAPSVRLRFRVR